MGLKYYVKVCLWIWECVLSDVLVTENVALKKISNCRGEGFVCVCVQAPASGSDGPQVVLWNSNTWHCNHSQLWNTAANAGNYISFYTVAALPAAFSVSTASRCWIGLLNNSQQRLVAKVLALFLGTCSFQRWKRWSNLKRKVGFPWFLLPHVCLPFVPTVFFSSRRRPPPATQSCFHCSWMQASW